MNNSPDIDDMLEAVIHSFTDDIVPNLADGLGQGDGRAS